MLLFVRKILFNLVQVCGWHIVERRLNFYGHSILYPRSYCRRHATNEAYFVAVQCQKISRLANTS